MLSFNMPRHATLVDPQLALITLNLAPLACKVDKLSEATNCKYLFQISTLFILVHSMRQSQVIFQNGFPFVIFSTMNTLIKGWFSVRPFYVSV